MEIQKPKQKAVPVLQYGIFAVSLLQLEAFGDCKPLPANVANPTKFLQLSLYSNGQNYV